MGALLCRRLHRLLSQDDDLSRHFMPWHGLEQKLLLRALSSGFPACPVPNASRDCQDKFNFVMERFGSLLTLEEKLQLGLRCTAPELMLLSQSVFFGRTAWNHQLLAHVDA